MSLAGGGKDGGNSSNEKERPRETLSRADAGKRKFFEKIAVSEQNALGFRLNQFPNEIQNDPVATINAFADFLFRNNYRYGNNEDCQRVSAGVFSKYGYQRVYVNAEANCVFLFRVKKFIDGNWGSNVDMNGATTAEYAVFSSHVYNVHQGFALDATLGIYCLAANYSANYVKIQIDHQRQMLQTCAPEVKRFLQLDPFQSRVIAGLSVNAQAPKFVLVKKTWSTSATCDILGCNNSLGFLSGHHHCRSCGKAICRTHSVSVERRHIPSPMFKDDGESNETGKLYACTVCTTMNPAWTR